MEILLPIGAMFGLYVMANNGTSERKRQGFRGRRSQLPNTNTPNRNFPVENKEAVMEHLNYYKTNPNAPGASELFNKVRVVGDTGDDVESSKAEKKEEAKARKTDKNFLSLTGEKMGEGGFRHNNMQPFFGSTVKQRTGDFASAEAYLDNMQGAGTTTINKESIAPLFKPQQKMHWVNGMPNASDFIQSRMNPSRNMANVKPWADVRVAPGLNKKEGFIGSGGFNSGMEARERWIDRSVDELRIKTNPKVTYEGVVLGGSARAGHYKRGLQGKVEKNRPDTFYLNGADRWFTTNSAAGEASTSRATQPDRPVNRPGTSREYFGGSVNDGVGTYVPGQTQQPKKPVYTKEPSKGPANGISGVWKANAPPAVTNDLGKSSFKNRANGRSLTGETQQFGAVSTYAKAMIAPVMDILRPSRKENAVGTIRPTGNAHSTVSKPPAYNPADQPKTTMKETTIESKNFGGMPNSETNDGYLVNIANNSERAVRQQRDDTNCEYISNPGTALRSKARVYNAEYNMSLNADKQILTQGRSPNGNMAIYNGYTNIKIDKLDSDRNPNRGTFSNNSTIVGGPSKEILGKMHQRAPIGMGQSCTRNSSDMLDAFRCNPYTQSLHGAA